MTTAYARELEVGALVPPCQCGHRYRHHGEGRYPGGPCQHCECQGYQQGESN